MTPPIDTYPALRELAGESANVVATRAGVRTSVVERLEEGHPVDRSDAARVARAFGVDPSRLRTRVRPVPDAVGTLFAFSGDLTELSSHDLGSFARTLTSARRWLTEVGGADGLALRQRLVPSEPRGPASADAARHGHLLARQLRAALGVPAEPIGDIRALSEERLGIVVGVHHLRTRMLRAGAMLDVEGSAAAIVVNGSLRDSRLLRVAIAHEICHLVFDPSGAHVSITLDVLPAGPSHELRENRARAFAAEFLVPLVGLQALFGPPVAEGDPGKGRALVETTASRFGVSWDLGCYHLYNLGYTSVGCRDELLSGVRAVGLGLPETSLPIPGADPLCLARVHGAHDPTAGARSSRESSRMMLRQAGAHATETAAKLVSEQVVRAETDWFEAGVALVHAFEGSLERGDHVLAEAYLRAVDPYRLHGDATVAFLSNVRRSCLQLGGKLHEAYSERARAAVKALAQTWAWEADDVVDASETLQG